MELVTDVNVDNNDDDSNNNNDDDGGNNHDNINADADGFVATKQSGCCFATTEICPKKEAIKLVDAIGPR